MKRCNMSDKQIPQYEFSADEEKTMRDGNAEFFNSALEGVKSGMKQMAETAQALTPRGKSPRPLGDQ